jgi:phosphoglycolate phosphatase-like HAD superfamily hydrolase
VRFRVLALDYDGTIAKGGDLQPDVRAALAEVRAQGIAILLVTGRRLDDLRAVAGDLGFADASFADRIAPIRDHDRVGAQRRHPAVVHAFLSRPSRARLDRDRAFDGNAARDGRGANAVERRQGIPGSVSRRIEGGGTTLLAA